MFPDLAWKCNIVRDLQAKFAAGHIGLSKG